MEAQTDFQRRVFVLGRHWYNSAAVRHHLDGWRPARTSNAGVVLGREHVIICCKIHEFLGNLGNLESNYKCDVWKTRILTNTEVMVTAKSRLNCGFTWLVEETNGFALQLAKHTRR